MRGKWLLFGGIVVLAGIGAGALSLLRRPAAAPAPAQPAAAPPLGPEVSLSGKIQARRVVPVEAPSDGVMEVSAVDVGQDVFEGQLLARIKNTTLESAVERAQLEFDGAQTRVANLDATLISARLEAARAEADSVRARLAFEKVEKLYTRQQLLSREGATPRLVFERTQREYQSVSAEYQNLREVAEHANERVAEITKSIDAARRTFEEKSQELDLAKEELAATEVHSPVDGILVARRAETGGEVDRSMKDLFQIAVELASLEVVVEPTPPVLARIRPGQPAAVRVAEVGNEPLAGSVRDIKGTQVFVEFISPNPAIRPGLTAQTTIKIE